MKAHEGPAFGFSYGSTTGEPPYSRVKFSLNPLSLVGAPINSPLLHSASTVPHCTLQRPLILRQLRSIQ